MTTISIYNLFGLRPTNVNKSHKIKWFHIKNVRSRRNSAETIMDADKADDQVPLINSTAKAWSRLYVNSDKTEFMCLKKDGAISALNGKLLKLVDHFTYLGINIPST